MFNFNFKANVNAKAADTKATKVAPKATKPAVWFSSKPVKVAQKTTKVPSGTTSNKLKALGLLQVAAADGARKTNNRALAKALGGLVSVANKGFLKALN